MALIAHASRIRAADQSPPAPPDPDKPPGRPAAEPQQNIRIELNEKAAKLGFTRKEVLRQIYARYAGGGVSVADLSGTLLTTKDGKLVRLGEIATIHPSQEAAPGGRGSVPRENGKIKSQVLTKAMVELWPRLATALGEADDQKIPPLSPAILREVTETTEAFWVTLAEERRFRSGTFDDEYNARKLDAVVRQYAKYRRELPRGLAFLQRESNAGRLKGARLELMLRMATDVLREERQRARVLAACPGGKKLSFRIAPLREGPRKSPAPSPAEIDRYKTDLARDGPSGGRKRGDAHAWFEAADHPDAARGLIAATYRQRTYVLLCNQAPYVILPQDGGAEAWGLERVYHTTDRDGAPAVAFQLDDAGSRRFARLTSACKGRRLAVLVDDRVYSTPRIMEGISKRGIITGRFSREEARELAWLLEQGMEPARLRRKEQTKKP